jgi:hypothetical protein
MPRKLTILAALAGLLYCSWPLGYRLNPVANRGLASNLEGTGQPYNWLFISLDILSGVIMCYVAYQLYRRVVVRHQSRWLLAAIIGLGSFGLLTALDAMLPIDCVSSATVVCPPVLDDPYVIVHGVASIGSIYSLTVSVVALWWLLSRSLRVGSGLRWMLHSTVLVWFGFGCGTAVLLYLNKSSALSQHIFIIVCSAWTAAMPYLVQRSMLLQPALRRLPRRR